MAVDPHRSLVRTLTSTLVIQGLGFASGALVARMLGVDARGVLAALVLWPAIIVNLGDLGGPVAYVYQAAKRPTEHAKLVANGILLVAIQGVLLAAVGIPLLSLMLARYHAYLALGFILLVVFLPLNLFTRYLNAINQGARRFARFNALRIIVQLSYVIAVLALFFASRGTVRTIVAAVIFSNVAVLVVAIAQQRKNFRRLALDRRLMRETISYGLRAHVGNLTPIDSMQLDLAVVVALLGAHEAGLYAIAVSAAMVVRAQGTTFGMVAFPTVASGDPDDARSTGASIFRLTLLLNLATATVIGGGAWLLVPLVYGQAFSPAAPILQVLVVGIVAASLRQVLGDCLRGLGKPLAATLAEVVSWFVAVSGLVILVPLLGAIGAALAVSASYVAALSVAVFLAERNGFSLSSLFLPRPADIRTLLAFPRELVGRPRVALARPSA